MSFEDFKYDVRYQLSKYGVYGDFEHPRNQYENIKNMFEKLYEEEEERVKKCKEEIDERLRMN